MLVKVTYHSGHDELFRCSSWESTEVALRLVGCESMIAAGEPSEHKILGTVVIPLRTVRRWLEQTEPH